MVEAFEHPETGNVAVAVVGQDNLVHVRYLNPYAPPYEAEENVPIKVSDELKEQVKRWILGKNSTKAFKNDPLELVSY